MWTISEEAYFEGNNSIRQVEFEVTVEHLVGNDW